MKETTILGVFITGLFSLAGIFISQQNWLGLIIFIVGLLCGYVIKEIFK